MVRADWQRFAGFVLTQFALPRLLLFQERYVGRGYRPAFDGAQNTFRDTETGVRIEFLTAGEFPGDGLPKPVAFPDPAAPGVSEERDDIRVISLEKLIELKLASGLSAPHRLRDLADVQDLILRLRLPLDLADGIDPSVQPEYRRLWQQVQGGIQPDRKRFHPLFSRKERRDNPRLDLSRKKGPISVIRDSS